jgi:ABC-type branched-subunit amino acid transport system substrate-binding protein
VNAVSVLNKVMFKSLKRMKSERKMNKNIFKKGSTRRNTAIVASVVAMLSALTFAPAQAAPTVKVGVLTDMTGAFGIVGKSNKAVAQFTINEINKSGGVLGR